MNVDLPRIQELGHILLDIASDRGVRTNVP